MFIQSTKIPGCYEIIPDRMKDRRGEFIKIYTSELLKSKGLETKFVEQYYSISYQGVLRGLHFQIPPKDHAKMVYLISGQIIDAVVDLRIDSPTFGKFELFELKAETGNMVYIPRGIAHGFYVLSETATVIYNATSSYSLEHDTGILWNSAEIPWPTKEPILSKRDLNFPSLKDFTSPFLFNGGEKFE